HAGVHVARAGGEQSTRHRHAQRHLLAGRAPVRVADRQPTVQSQGAGKGRRAGDAPRHPRAGAVEAEHQVAGVLMMLPSSGSSTFRLTAAPSAYPSAFPRALASEPILPSWALRPTGCSFVERRQEGYPVPVDCFASWEGRCFSPRPVVGMDAARDFCVRPLRPWSFWTQPVNLRGLVLSVTTNLMHLCLRYPFTTVLGRSLPVRFQHTRRLPHAPLRSDRSNRPKWGTLFTDPSSRWELNPHSPQVVRITS